MIGRVTYLCGVGLIVCTKDTTGCSLLWLGLMLGLCEMYRILYIGSYVYHSDVIAVATQSNANKYKVNSTYYYQVYCISNLLQCMLVILRIY